MQDNPLSKLPLHASGPPPRSAGAATVMLHGRGGSPEDMMRLAAALELPGMAFVAPSAAGGSWYPDRFMAPRERNEPHLGWALARVLELALALESQGVPRARVALVGFSQGACLSCETLLRYPARWGALAALTGGLIGPPETAWPEPGSLSGTPVLLSISEDDEWVPLPRAQQTAQVFGSMGARVELRTKPGRSHEVSEDEIRATRALLAPLLAKQEEAGR